jgi:Trp operon repressor
VAPKIPKDLLAVLAAIDDPKILSRVLADLLTEGEIQSIGERWEIVKLLEAGNSQRQVRDRLGVSVTTVNRGNRQLKYGTGGFRAALDLLAELRRPR